ncbi:MAG TPA: prolyl oligopeptidase family serine peptidase [Sphingobacteriaceae bacterium]
MKKHRFRSLLLIGGILASNYSSGQDNLTYQKPPQEILELLNAPSTPQVRFNSKGDWMLLFTSPDLPSIEQVSQPMLRIGGLRINPASNSAFSTAGYTAVKLKNMASGKEYPVSGLPEKARIGNVAWSPDESKIAFTNSTPTGIELWVADLRTYTARKLTGGQVNNTYGDVLEWSPDGQGVLAQFVVEDRGGLPSKNNTPGGPVMQQNLGKAAPSRTYQDLLKNPYDEKLFDYYLTSQLKKIDLNGIATNIGEPAIYRGFNYSPDGSFILTETIQRPYSYLVPAGLFPYKVQVLGNRGNVVKDVYSAPLADNRPTGFDAVSKGQRNHAWRSDQPATLYWVETQDEGNPNKDVKVRDIVFQLSAPFSGQPAKLAQTRYRYAGISWAKDNLAILNERWWKTRTQKSSLINPSAGSVVKVIGERSYENTYTDPGSFVTVRNQFNRPVLLLDKGKAPVAFTIGTGASPQGDRPFLMKWNLASGKQDTLFRSKAPYYERPVFFANAGTLIISREGVEQAPNYYQVNLKNRSAKPVTAFPDPYPSLRGVQKQQLSYKRGDGLTLSGTLYLPKGYKKSDGPLPVLMWAYPREFKTASAAGQVKGTPFQFTRVSWASPVYWVNRGYAVLDNADMPIVGEGKNEPNDTFVAQLQDNAKSAINYLTSLGVADPKRVAIGGHSYGAFMTANLLAHTDLFAAGIARSGAYNRTLTPFGFQQEERTYWQAPQIYSQMSPFSYADKIKEPILLIHGEADENSGTFPVQSERFYNALKGHGATSRLVFLPAEAHSYRAEESVSHMLWEMDQWLDKYVKNKK